ncbi:hypothetical protein PCASD_10573 [Puccinia coronata f. sp. avenae]|uniref:Uncharacterized protein n=1 Tax=Puccinia coronata f. sp. avenae TaxID=200324 RepID=A0A2N5UL34_9BASI|nr:hypothetical protein PCASD_10573 [Puccinia coronata f. sp. avenae]
MKLREALIIALSICPFQSQLMDVGLRFRGSTRSKEQALLNGSTWGGQTSSYRSAARADPLDSSDLQQRSDAIEEAKKAFQAIKLKQNAEIYDKNYWNIPYEWDEEYSILSAQKETDQILNAFLYNGKEEAQMMWLVGDGKKSPFTHPMKDIPLVERLISLYKWRKEDELKCQLTCAFNRIKNLYWQKRERIQDASIFNFIIALSVITDCRQRSAKNNYGIENK